MKRLQFWGSILPDRWFTRQDASTDARSKMLVNDSQHWLRIFSESLLLTILLICQILIPQATWQAGPKWPWRALRAAGLICFCPAIYMWVTHLEQRLVMPSRGT